MKTNVGTIDCAVRIVIGVCLLAWAVFETGPWRWVGLLGFVPLATALVGTCPMYSVLGVSTCRKTSGL